MFRVVRVSFVVFCVVAFVCAVFVVPFVFSVAVVAFVFIWFCVGLHSSYVCV